MSSEARRDMERKFEQVRRLRDLIEELCAEGEEQLSQSIHRLKAAGVIKANDSKAEDSLKKTYAESIAGFKLLYNQAVGNFILDRGQRIKKLFETAIKIRKYDNERGGLPDEEVEEDSELEEDVDLAAMEYTGPEVQDNEPVLYEPEEIEAFSWLSDEQMERWKNLLIELGLKIKV